MVGSGATMGPVPSGDGAEVLRRSRERADEGRRRKGILQEPLLARGDNPTPSIECAACGRIVSAAAICPHCGVDPVTGQSPMLSSRLRPARFQQVPP